MRTCDECGTPIPAARLEALPGTTTCTAHSRAKKPKGFMISNYSKGTASEIVLVDTNDRESLRLAERANARRR